jgi:hypothetical protein
VKMGAIVFGVVVLVAGAAQARIDAPVAARSSEPASIQDYREILVMLRHIDRALDRLEAVVGGRSRQPEGDGWQIECRGYSPEKTVRCAAAKFDPPGGVAQAVAVWSCESNFGIEPPHSDAYHGPFQYLYSTYQSQQESMPDVVDWYELSPAVHDVRSNILTAVAWAARNSWGPWGCA